MPAGEGAARDGLLHGAASLAASLNKQHGIYASMLDLTMREEQAIVDGDVAELTAIVEEKETLIEHLNALETERMTALVAIADATGIDPEAATLSEVVAHLPPPAGLALTESGVQQPRPRRPLDSLPPRAAERCALHGRRDDRRRAQRPPLAGSIGVGGSPWASPSG
jgi:hypothetical protein